MNSHIMTWIFGAIPQMTTPVPMSQVEPHEFVRCADDSDESLWDLC
jgi:hypothetical protein